MLTKQVPRDVLMSHCRLDTVNALPPNLIYKSASQTAKELVPELREQGCTIVIALTHGREPNDIKLAEKTPTGQIDLVLGGHDHFYSHHLLNSTHVLRSGSDFRQLSYIEGWKKADGGWDFSITRQDITRNLPEDPATVELVKKLSSSLASRLEKPIGYTAAPLDARFTTVRTKESNIGNFVCDLMRFYYATDCALMASGTIRGDCIYMPGVLRLKDIMNCFPFEDPVVVIRICGQDVLDALENSVCLVPALEGRYPQVSNITFEYDPEQAPGSRVMWAKIHDKPIDLRHSYTMATRGYMGRGKDGFDSLLVKSEGGSAEEIVSEENGVLISTILRQYFLSLKIVGRWRRWSPSLHKHWGGVHDKLHQDGKIKEPGSSKATSPLDPRAPIHNAHAPPKHGRNGSLKHHHQHQHAPHKHNDNRTHDTHLVDSDSDNEEMHTSPVTPLSVHPRNRDAEDRELHLARSVAKRWMRLAGVHRSNVGTVSEADEEFTPHWTKGIAPKLEGRIQVTGGQKMDILSDGRSN